MLKGFIVVNKDKSTVVCTNTNDVVIKASDNVIYSLPDGYDIGVVKYCDVDLKQESFKDGFNIMRKANEDDVRKLEEIRLLESSSLKMFKQKVQDNLLDMKVVGANFRFDGFKIVFYFVAEHRVDFRQLVRDLASEYKRRIELRQIGVRDEAKAFDGIGVCGIRQCCSACMKEFIPIDTNMAKLQDLTINPDKISGNCGRLLCCLAYEKDFYTSQKSTLPEVGSSFSGTKGQGKIKKTNIFNETVSIEYPDGAIEVINCKTGKCCKNEDDG